MIYDFIYFTYMISYLVLKFGKLYEEYSEQIVSKTRFALECHHNWSPYARVPKYNDESSCHEITTYLELLQDSKSTMLHRNNTRTSSRYSQRCH